MAQTAEIRLAAIRFNPDDEHVGAGPVLARAEFTIKAGGAGRIPVEVEFACSQTGEDAVANAYAALHRVVGAIHDEMDRRSPQEG